MNITAKTLIPMVLLVLLTIGVYLVGLGSQIQSSAFKMLPQGFITMFIDFNTSSSLSNQRTNGISTEQSWMNIFPNFSNSFSSKHLTESTTLPLHTKTRSTSFIVETSISTITPISLSIIKLYNTTPSTNKTCYITSRDMREGRLGNQMFRYASLLGIALSQGRQLIIPSGSELEMTFKLSYVSDNPMANRWASIREIDCFTFDTRLMSLPKKDWSIWGYLQSHRYFSSFGDEIRQEFLFRDSVDLAAAKIIHNLLQKYTGSLLVGVHSRRGDFLRFQKSGYVVPEKSYFVQAFQWMKSKFPGRNVTFLVASDDIGWVRANLEAEDVVVVPPASPGVHMAVLSSCEHMVISGGTFGWWSGWMAGGYVVYFTGYMAKGTQLGKKFVPSNYYPPLWVGLGN